MTRRIDGPRSGPEKRDRSTTSDRERPVHRRGMPARVGRRRAARRDCARSTPRREGIRKLFRSLARGSSASDTLPVFVQRVGSSDSKLSTSTRATPGRWSTTWTPGRGSEISGACQPTPRRTVVGLIDRREPESRRASPESSRKSGGLAPERSDRHHRSGRSTRLPAERRRTVLRMKREPRSQAARESRPGRGLPAGMLERLDRPFRGTSVWKTAQSRNENRCGHRGCSQSVDSFLVDSDFFSSSRLYGPAHARGSPTAGAGPAKCRRKSKPP